MVYTSPLSLPAIGREQANEMQAEFLEVWIEEEFFRLLEVSESCWLPLSLDVGWIHVPNHPGLSWSCEVCAQQGVRGKQGQTADQTRPELCPTHRCSELANSHVMGATRGGCSLSLVPEHPLRLCGPLVPRLCGGLCPKTRLACRQFGGTALPTLKHQPWAPVPKAGT